MLKVHELLLILKFYQDENSKKVKLHRTNVIVLWCDKGLERGDLNLSLWLDL